MEYKILLAEDDPNFGDVLKSYLTLNDYEVDLAKDGVEAHNLSNKNNYNLFLLDVMMPKMDGFQLAEKIREKNKNTPIIFLTAKTLKEDVLKGFKIGADDYITKPFNSEELLYRVKAVLKRSGDKGKNTDQVEFNLGKYHFDFSIRILTFNKGKSDEVKQKLSPKESQLLRMFASHKNQILPRDMALNEIWGKSDYFTARSMDVFVTKLRNYLSKDSKLEIENIHGTGFRLLDEES